MADQDLLAVLKTIQAQLQSQAVDFQSLKQNVQQVEGRMDDLRDQFLGTTETMDPLLSPTTPVRSGEPATGGPDLVPLFDL